MSASWVSQINFVFVEKQKSEPNFRAQFEKGANINEIWKGVRVNE